jgi:serine/threonine-protein kinase RsbW
MMEAAMVEVRRDGREGVRAVRLRIPARPEFVVLSRLALTGLAAPAGISEEALADLKLALTEAVSNSVRHGYRDGDGSVEIAYELSRETIEIEVADAGAGFGLEPRLATGETGPREGGLGLPLARAVVDELELESSAGAGSRVRIVKRLLPE